MQLLEFKNISKKYGSFEALKNISFSIPENSIFGILGTPACSVRRGDPNMNIK